MNIRYYLVSDVISGCHIYSIYGEPMNKVKENSNGVFIDVYHIFDNINVVSTPPEYLNKKIAKVVFVGDEIDPDEWESEQKCNLEHINEEKFLELAETSKLFNQEKQIKKEVRDKEIKGSKIILSNGIELDADDISLYRTTAIVTSGILMVLQQLAQRDDNIKSAFNKIKKIDIPFKDANNKFQTLNFSDIAEAQKLILDSFSKLFKEFD